MLFNLYQKRTNNVGDLHCSPCDYFNIPAIPLDIFDYDPKWGDHIILGGGGVFTFESRLQMLIETGCHVLTWGAGSNSTEHQHIHYPGFMDGFLLQGLRDYPTTYDWVPCASCMHSIFDQNVEITTDSVVYGHKSQPVNTSSSIEEVVAFIGSAETIYTDSYHGAYWAILLGRKVVVDPWSSKFYGFKWPIATSKKQTRSVYPEALEEARAANQVYYEKVMNLVRGKGIKVYL